MEKTSDTERERRGKSVFKKKEKQFNKNRKGCKEEKRRNEKGFNVLLVRNGSDALHSHFRSLL